MRIESVKLDFKDKAQAKVGSLDNAHHIPGGGHVMVSASSMIGRNPWYITKLIVPFPDAMGSGVVGYFGLVDGPANKPQESVCDNPGISLDLLWSFQRIVLRLILKISSGNF